MPRANLHQSEAEFQTAVLELAHWEHWLSHHHYDARRSSPGWVDVVLAKAGHPLILAELKTARGRIRPAQQQWLEVLSHTSGVHVALWRPEDWPGIEALLTAK